jgi:hypothetical protein
MHVHGHVNCQTLTSTRPKFNQLERQTLLVKMIPQTLSILVIAFASLIQIQEASLCLVCKNDAFASLIQTRFCFFNTDSRIQTHAHTQSLWQRSCDFYARAQHVRINLAGNRSS